MARIYEAHRPQSDCKGNRVTRLAHVVMCNATKFDACHDVLSPQPWFDGWSSIDQLKQMANQTACGRPNGIRRETCCFCVQTALGASFQDNHIFWIPRVNVLAQGFSIDSRTWAASSHKVLSDRGSFTCPYRDSACARDHTRWAQDRVLLISGKGSWYLGSVQ